MGETVVGRHSSHGNGAPKTLSVVKIMGTTREGQGARGPQLLPDHDWEALWVTCGCNPSTQEAEMGERPQI